MVDRRRPVVIMNTMPENMKEEALNLIVDSFTKYRSTETILFAITNEFRSKYGSCWQCHIGKHLRCHISTVLPTRVLHVLYGKYEILLIHVNNCEPADSMTCCQIM